MDIRLTHLDGGLPNLALMKLAHWHKERGDTVHLVRGADRQLFEPDYDVVYGSVIFTANRALAERLVSTWPAAIVGGTGLLAKASPIPNALVDDIGKTVEQTVIGGEYEHYDYSIYPAYPWSLGFTARGCRLKCGFCVVPQKEGKPRAVNSLYDIWRPGTPRNVVLLDNDFFGQPAEQWRARVEEILSGGFKVSFNQGINVRLIDDTAAYWLARLPYYDDQFKTRRLYTAWDNLKDERIFFEGVDRLERAGVVGLQNLRGGSDGRHSGVRQRESDRPGDDIQRAQRHRVGASPGHALRRRGHGHHVHAGELHQDQRPVLPDRSHDAPRRSGGRRTVHRFGVRLLPDQRERS